MSNIKAVKRNGILRRGDLLLIAGLLAVGIIAAVSLSLLLPKGTFLSVERNGEVIAEYPLNEDVSVIVEDESGYNLIVIKEGAAYVERADCRCGVCTAHSPISREGETVICLPHRLVLRVVSEVSGNEA